jgi:hypothetical protein
MKTVLRWTMILVFVPVLANWFYLEPLYRAARVLAPRPAAVEVSAPLSTPGHGAFCNSGAEPSVFLGRDVPELGSYAAFADWCEARGGELGWTV